MKTTSIGKIKATSKLPKRLDTKWLFYRRASVRINIIQSKIYITRFLLKFITPESLLRYHHNAFPFNRQYS